MAQKQYKLENLIHTIEEVPKDKSLIIFDLDGTLTESKMGMDGEMGELFNNLVKTKKVAVIGGASLKQMVSQLPENSGNGNLFLLPLDGGAFYEYTNSQWHEIYRREIPLAQKAGISEALARAGLATGYLTPQQTYGPIVEDRGSQMTWSALGQSAPLAEKEKWNQAENGLRSRMVALLEQSLPNLEVKVAGLTSIDITLKGIDKKFGIEQVLKHLGLTVADALFVGDALEGQGNDTPALASGVMCFEVKSVADTKKLIEYLLN
jgi:hypothetical protein